MYFVFIKHERIPKIVLIAGHLPHEVYKARSSFSEAIGMSRSYLCQRRSLACFAYCLGRVLVLWVGKGSYLLAYELDRKCIELQLNYKQSES